MCSRRGEVWCEREKGEKRDMRTFIGSPCVVLFYVSHVM